MWEVKIVWILMKIYYQGIAGSKIAIPMNQGEERDMDGSTENSSYTGEDMMIQLSVDEADLNCGALLHEFLRDRMNHNRFDQACWRGYEDPTWVDEADLNCGALLHEFLRDRTNHNRFGVMQSHEES
ncbi:Hypothetical protein PHPALM_19252 [Phytophthora palmivora]|uniref:Chromo domain-containing protein n=1 Tax=Phytophthora palmivora TaxID=4796 RepID=A0A2P4XHR4_9STRA|nr:Hypothetical protein PHPALM_19252 [Phytophthora palmivora]